MAMDRACDRLVGLELISSARPPNRPALSFDFSLYLLLHAEVLAL